MYLASIANLSELRTSFWFPHSSWGLDVDSLNQEEKWTSSKLTLQSKNVNDLSLAWSFSMISETVSSLGIWIVLSGSDFWPFLRNCLVHLFFRIRKIFFQVILSLHQRCYGGITFLCDQEATQCQINTFSNGDLRNEKPGNWL